MWSACKFYSIPARTLGQATSASSCAYAFRIMKGRPHKTDRSQTMTAAAADRRRSSGGGSSSSNAVRTLPVPGHMIVPFPRRGSSGSSSQSTVGRYSAGRPSSSRRTKKKTSPAPMESVAKRPEAKSDRKARTRSSKRDTRSSRATGRRTHEKVIVDFPTIARQNSLGDSFRRNDGHRRVATSSKSRS